MNKCIKNKVINITFNIKIILNYAMNELLTS